MKNFWRFHFRNEKGKLNLQALARHWNEGTFGSIPNRIALMTPRDMHLPATKELHPKQSKDYNEEEQEEEQADNRLHRAHQWDHQIPQGSPIPGKGRHDCSMLPTALQDVFNHFCCLFVARVRQVRGGRSEGRRGVDGWKGNTIIWSEWSILLCISLANYNK